MTTGLVLGSSTSTPSARFRNVLLAYGVTLAVGLAWGINDYATLPWHVVTRTMLLAPPLFGWWTMLALVAVGVGLVSRSVPGIVLGCLGLSAWLLLGWMLCALSIT